jgi:hypothetical protein
VLRISSLVRTVNIARLANTYIPVVSGIEIQIAKGRFLYGKNDYKLHGTKHDNILLVCLINFKRDFNVVPFEKKFGYMPLAVHFPEFPLLCIPANCGTGNHYLSVSLSEGTVPFRGSSVYCRCYTSTSWTTENRLLPLVRSGICDGTVVINTVWTEPDGTLY